MKTYTQLEFNALPIVDGYRVCPTGDYRQIRKFGDYCEFGESCKFGDFCEFGESCKFGDFCYELVRRSLK